MHKPIDLPIHYFGTPVVLISTINEDGTTNIAPSSSIWWLGKSCMIGLDGSSKTTENLRRTKECVLNLASADIVDSVNSIANTTGTKNVPLHKKTWGYRYLKHKEEEAGLTLQMADNVKASRIAECQVQLEACVSRIHGFSKTSIVPMFAFELEILQSHIEESILMGDQNQYVDPDKWHPLIMNFRKFYTTNDYIHPSKLAETSVEKYRQSDMGGVTGWIIKKVFGALYKRSRIQL